MDCCLYTANTFSTSACLLACLGVRLQPFLSLTAAQFEALLPLLTKVPAPILAGTFQQLAAAPNGTLDNMLLLLSKVGLVWVLMEGRPWLDEQQQLSPQAVHPVARDAQLVSVCMEGGLHAAAQRTCYCSVTRSAPVAGLA